MDGWGIEGGGMERWGWSVGGVGGGGMGRWGDGGNASQYPVLFTSQADSRVWVGSKLGLASSC